MNAQPNDILPAPDALEAIRSGDISCLHFHLFEVNDDASDLLAKQAYAAVTDLKNEAEIEEGRELKPINRAKSEVKAKYKRAYVVLDEARDHYTGQSVAYRNAKARLLEDVDSPDSLDVKPAHIETISEHAVIATRTITKVIILNKDKIPEKYKIVDESAILQDYRKDGEFRLGMNCDGAFEIKEETLEYLKRS